MRRNYQAIVIFFGAAFLLAACNGMRAGELEGGIKSFFGLAPSATELPSATRTPFLPTAASLPPAPTPTSAPQSSPTTAAQVWLSPDLPSTLLSSFVLPAGWTTAAAAGEATVQLRIGLDRPISTWIYALVAPFPTVVDGVSIMDIHKAWSGQGGSPFSGRPLLVDQNTLEVFTALWGIPAPGATQSLPADQLTDAAWAARPAWGIVPWEEIGPRWKVLEIDGQSPLRKEFDAGVYPLAVPVSCLGDAELCRQIGGSSLPPINRDPAKLTTVVLTGVTALVRATAAMMESRGILYPAQDIGPLLQAADLTHISNEIPFWMNCPPPDPNPGMMRFCSDPRYIDLLEYIGTDIVELTGNHVLDYGSDALLYTLDLYRQRGWRYYAGGDTLASARAPLLVEHNGNRLAFIGCNKPGYSSEWATDTTPGAAPCDFEYLRKEIARLRSENYLPIMTFQYIEYYQYRPTPEQIQDFHKASDAGAVIVSGSQAHQPQTFEFSGGAFIHYGLGNLFFDQYGLEKETELAFIDRHIFYQGRYLGVELITIRFVDSARPRFMTAEERSSFLATVFSLSGW
jgi:hypothetical protein